MGILQNTQLYWLLSVFFGGILFFACKKEFQPSDEVQNAPHWQATEVQFQEVQASLVTTLERQLFDFNFASEHNPHIIPLASDRDNQALLNAFCIELIHQNQANNFADQLIAAYGYPIWDRSLFIESSEPSVSGTGIILPLAFLSADSCQAFIMATPLDSFWHIKLVSRQDVNALIAQATPAPNLFFKIAVFNTLDFAIFGKTNPIYSEILTSGNIQPGIAGDRWCIAYTICQYMVLIGTGTEDRSCTSYLDCYDPGGGGSYGGFGTFSFDPFGNNSGGGGSGNGGLIPSGTTVTPSFTEFWNLCESSFEPGEPGSSSPLNGAQLSLCEKLRYLNDLGIFSTLQLQTLSLNSDFLDAVTAYLVASQGNPMALQNVYDVINFFGDQFPPNFDTNGYLQLLQLQSICHFNDSQFDWVSKDASLVPLINGLLSQHNNAPAWIQALKDVIDARVGGTDLFSWENMTKLVEIQVALNLTQVQLKWLIDHSVTQMTHKVIDQVYPFFTLHQNDQTMLDAVPIHIDLLMDSAEEYSIANQQAGYPELGTEAWAGTINFAVEEIPKTTEAEKVLALMYPYAALEIYRNRPIARQKQLSFWGNNSNVTWLGKGDAFLHTYYQAINTQDVGKGLTLLFATAHETEHPAVLQLETDMDLFNNSIGAQTGEDNPSATIHTMADIVHLRILNGDCKYLDPVDHVFSQPYQGSSCSTCLNGILPTTIIKWTNQ